MDGTGLKREEEEGPGEKQPFRDDGTNMHRSRPKWGLVLGGLSKQKFWNLKQNKNRLRNGDQGRGYQKGAWGNGGKREIQSIIM